MPPEKEMKDVIDGHTGKDGPEHKSENVNGSQQTSGHGHRCGDAEEKHKDHR